MALLVSDYVGKVSSPEGGETLFLIYTRKAVPNTVVFDHACCVFSLLCHGILDLEEELDTLKGATTVLDTAAEIPPIKKSVAKFFLGGELIINNAYMSCKKDLIAW